MIEGTHELGHFAGGDERDAVLVLAGGDLVHGIGQRFDGARDLLGQKQSQPHAGKEDDDGDEQQHQEEGGAELVARAKEIPVVGGAGTNARGGLAESLGHGKSGNHDLAGSGRGFTQGVILLRRCG